MSATLTVTGHDEAVAKMMKLMEETKRYGSKGMSEIAAKQTKELAYALAAETKATEHDRDWYLTTLPVEKNWRIKSKNQQWKGRDHAMKELRNRAKHRFYLSSPWSNLARMLTGQKLPPSARVNMGELKMTGSLMGRFVVAIRNLISYAEGQHRRKGITARALERVNQSMSNYIRYKRGEITKEALRASNLRAN